MLELHRALRYRDEIKLPNGEIVAVNFNAEARALELLHAENGLNKVVFALKGKRMTDGEKAAYHRAYMTLIEVIFGDAATKTMLSAFDGDREELIGVLDFWIAEHIIPLGLEASRRIRARKAVEYRRNRARK